MKLSYKILDQTIFKALSLSTEFRDFLKSVYMSTLKTIKIVVVLNKTLLYLSVNQNPYYLSVTIWINLSIFYNNNGIIFSFI